MTQKVALPSLFALGVLFAGVPSLQAADSEGTRGAELYESRCGACHSVERNRIGPRHRAVLGRTAGTQPGYDYSKALKDSDLIWNEKTLDSWLTNPQALIPGQKMGFRVRKPEDRSDIIAYLRTLGRATGPAAE